MITSLAATAVIVSQMGVVNPAVTQQNIQETICVAGWTDTIRPSTSYTNKIKRDSLPVGADISKYEGDHVLPLSLGGAPKNDEKHGLINIVPQPWRGQCGAYKKDVVERALHDQVCSGKITLKQAQKRFMPWVCAN